MQIALVYPDQPLWPKFDWLRHAFRLNGHEAYQVASVQSLEDADAEADLVIFRHKDAGLNHADVVPLASRRKSTWVQWWFDLVPIQLNLPLADQPCLRSFDGVRSAPTSWLQMMRAMDMVLVKERSLLDGYERLGVTARWFDQACPSTLAACEHEGSPQWDVLFYGSRYDVGPRSDDVTSLVSAGLSVAWAGMPGGGAPPGCLLLPFCPMEELPTLASHAAVTLCVDYRHDLDGYWSDRLWLALGMGACVVRRRSPGLPRGIEPHLNEYSSTGELVDLVRRLAADPTTRQAQGEAARKWVFAAHTYKQRCKQLLEMIECFKRELAEPAAGLAECRSRLPADVLNERARNAAARGVDTT